MFAVRGVAVSFSVFAMVYTALSLAVCGTWRRVWIYSQRHSVRPAARLLFGLRMTPLVAAGLITAAFTVPSFLLLEPRSINEPLGAIPLAVGLFGAVVGIFGILNASRALVRASRAIARWASDAQPMNTSAPVSVLRISGAVPPMAATGIVRPRVLLSNSAEFVLTASELQAALNHELVHVRRRDNLKKLLLRFVAFPGMRELEAAWVEASEMTADDAAVSTAREALDLAAALVKVSRLAALEPPVELTAALVRGPVAAMNARVERLIAWTERAPSGGDFRWYGAVAIVGAVTVFAGTYGQLLAGMHEATEWLVR
jgi:beta-lactamase regulating signal transducer with metallopeptidase domain